MTLEELRIRTHEIDEMEPAHAHYAEDQLLYDFVDEVAKYESPFTVRAAALSRFVKRDAKRWYE